MNITLPDQITQHEVGKSRKAFHTDRFNSVRKGSARETEERDHGGETEERPRWRETTVERQKRETTVERQKRETTVEREKRETTVENGKTFRLVLNK